MQAVRRIAIATASLAMLPACVWVSGEEHRARLGALDADGDGYVDRAAGGDDCNDQNPDVNPGAPERCETPDDDDCDGDVNGPNAVDLRTFHRDRDGDGWGTDTSVQACEPDPGFVALGGDCDDDDPVVHPGAPEVCKGLGLADRDCDPTPRACEAAADELIPVLTAPGAGTFLEDQGALLEVVGKQLYRWEAGKLERALTTRALAAAVGPTEERFGPVAVRGAWVAAALNDPPMEVWWRKLGAFSAAGTVEAINARSRSFGDGIAWVDDGVLAAIEVENPSKASLVLADLGAEFDTGTSRVIDGGASALVAGGPSGRRLLVAIQPDRRGGTLTILGEDRDDDVEISGSGLGSNAVAVADVDGDGVPDVLASAADAVYVWRGPFDRDLDLDDAWWRLPLDRPAHGLVVNALHGDGRPDLLVGDRDDGEVRVYVDAATRPTEPWAVVRGGRGGFGTSIGVTEIGLDGEVTRAIVIGDPARERIVALPWR